jgi:drug/metabolite transporter (DMT)-like permease
MSAAMLIIPMVDGFAKALSASYSPLFVSWARYAVASLIVLPLAGIAFGPAMLPGQRRIPHFVRTFFMVASMTLYFLAIARIPLATAISAFFVGPVIAVVLSILLLGERMTSRKGLSLGLGVVGTLVIARPGASFDPGILLAFCAGICFAFYLIATRLAAQTSNPLKTLAFQCIVGTLLLTPQALFTWSMPQADDLLLFAGLGLVSVISHGLSIAAFRYADASTLAPLAYLELVGATVIGYFAFQEVPGLTTIAGAILIAGAGLILVQRKGERSA